MMPPEKVTVLVITAVIAILLSVTLLNSSQEAARDQAEAWQVASARQGIPLPGGEAVPSVEAITAGVARTRRRPPDRGVRAPEDPAARSAGAGAVSGGSALVAHTIRRGDTLGALALRYLGRADARPLLAANPGVDPKKLVPGKEILIPIPDAPPAPPEEPLDPPAADGGRWYTVGPGDSLQKISKRAFGTTRHWRAIYQANRGRLRSPDWVREGQRLFLPALWGEG